MKLKKRFVALAVASTTLAANVGIEAQTLQPQLNTNVSPDLSLPAGGQNKPVGSTTQDDDNSKTADTVYWSEEHGAVDKPDFDDDITKYHITIADGNMYKIAIRDFL